MFLHNIIISIIVVIIIMMISSISSMFIIMYNMMTDQRMSLDLEGEVTTPHYDTANLRTKIMDFRGFDSSIILILRSGIPRPIGSFPECLSRAILVGIILVGRLGIRSTSIPLRALAYIIHVNMIATQAPKSTTSIGQQGAIKPRKQTHIHKSTKMYHVWQMTCIMSLSHSKLIQPPGMLREQLGAFSSPTR